MGRKRLTDEAAGAYREALLELSKLCPVSIENATNSHDIKWFWREYAASITLDMGHLELAGIDSIEFVQNLESDFIDIIDFQQIVRMVPIADTIARYAVDLVRATRPTDPTAPDFVKKYVNFGGSVRAAQFLALSAKARALMNHRYHVMTEDIASLMRPILRHRILLNFQAESDHLTQDDILKKILEAVPAPK